MIYKCRRHVGLERHSWQRQHNNQFRPLAFFPYWIMADVITLDKKNPTLKEIDLK